MHFKRLQRCQSSTSSSYVFVWRFAKAKKKKKSKALAYCNRINWFRAIWNRSKFSPSLRRYTGWLNELIRWFFHRKQLLSIRQIVFIFLNVMTKYSKCFSAHRWSWFISHSPVELHMCSARGQFTPIPIWIYSFNFISVLESKGKQFIIQRPESGIALSSLIAISLQTIIICTRKKAAMQFGPLNVIALYWICMLIQCLVDKSKLITKVYI